MIFIILFTVPVTLIMETITFRNLPKYVADQLGELMTKKSINYKKNNADIIINPSDMDDVTYKRLTGIMTTTLVKLEPELAVPLTKKSTAFVKTHIIGHEKARTDKKCLWITPKEYAGLIIAIYHKDTHVEIKSQIYFHRMTMDVKELVKKAKTYTGQLVSAIRSANIDAFEIIDNEIQNMIIPSFIIMDFTDEPHQAIEFKPVNAPAPSVQPHSWADVAKGNTVTETVHIETEHIQVDDETDKLFAELIAVQDKFNQKQLEQTKLLRDISALAAKMNDLQMKLGLVPAPM